jgi:NAD(P)-dependent dehydrogenase (short-subunit alcohol dehydrogenase family)
MGYLEGKVAVITGAGRGIGRQTAVLMAREGAKVVVNDLGGAPTGGGAGSASIARAVVDQIKADGGEAVADFSSISSMEGGKTLIEATLDHYGRIDFLINNAGIVRPKRLLEMTEQDFDAVLAVNLKGYFATIRAAAASLVRQGGAIVNLSSPSGFGHYGMSSYSAAKEGVVGLTRTAARELAEHGVRCNAVRPVTYDSNMNMPEVFETLSYQTDILKIPPISNQYLMGKAGTSENVAAVITWLCTPLSEPLNGREIYIFGSHLALVQEPELIRSQFKAEGWDFQSLCETEVTRALTYDLRNRYKRAPTEKKEF